ncbi:MAG: Uma2 family endonuclease [Phycisphaerae bacterium]
MTIADPHVHHFTLAEFEQMSDAGLFQDQRVELLDGEILDTSPQNEPHVYTVSVVNRFLLRHLPEEYQVRCQAPLAAGADSAPEPDIAVTQGGTVGNRPATALLVVEVADMSQAPDRRKIGVYAAAGVGEYWIIDLAARHIDQYSAPTDGGYANKKTWKVGESIECRVLPVPARPVADLLPPA